MDFEIAYGYYLGDTPLWDTDIVSIPPGTPQHRWTEACHAAFCADEPNEVVGTTIVFVTILMGPMDQDELMREMEEASHGH